VLNHFKSVLNKLKRFYFGVNIFIDVITECSGVGARDEGDATASGCIL